MSEDKPTIRKLPFQESGSCNKCGKRLLWISTEDDKRLPLDNEDTQQLWVTEASSTPMRARKRIVRTCHLDTCAGKKAKK